MLLAALLMLHAFTALDLPDAVPRLTFAHCDEALIAEVESQAPGVEQPLSVTCTRQFVFVAARGRHERIDREPLANATLAERVVSAIEVVQGHPPTIEPMPPQPKRQLEVWIEPLGTPIFATAGLFYVAAGVTVAVSPHWELVTSVGVEVGRAYGGDDEQATAAQIWQLWVSAAPVRLWHYDLGGPRSGFFLGPKLTLSISHSGSYSFYDGAAASAQTAFALEAGYEAGFRFELSRFEVTLTLPSFSLGYQNNRAEVVAFAQTTLSSDIGYDLDFNLLRLGVSF